MTSQKRSQWLDKPPYEPPKRRKRIRVPKAISDKTGVKSTETRAYRGSLTMHMVRQLCEIVGRGNFRTTAREKLSIPLETWKKWLRFGRIEHEELVAGTRFQKDLSPPYYLYVGLKAAENEAHDTVLTNVVNCDSPAVQLEFLKRRWPKLYNNVNNVAIDDETQEEVKIDATAMLLEKLSALIDK